jgi:hypothetical protein
MLSASRKEWDRNQKKPGQQRANQRARSASVTNENAHRNIQSRMTRLGDGNRQLAGSVKVQLPRRKMDRWGQKEICMLRKLSLVTALTAALALPTVAMAWDGYGDGGWGDHGGWGYGHWRGRHHGRWDYHPSGHWDRHGDHYDWHDTSHYDWHGHGHLGHRYHADD